MTREPQYVVREPQYVVKEPQYVVKEPQYVVKEPQYVVREPQYIVKDARDANYVVAAPGREVRIGLSLLALPPSLQQYRAVSIGPSLLAPPRLSNSTERSLLGPLC